MVDHYVDHLMDRSQRTKLHIMLQEARKRAGLTQAQLAGLSTVSVRAIRDLELGRVHRPRRGTLRLLADAMRLSGARRVQLELAVDSTSAGLVLQDEFGAELAAPPAALDPFFGREAEVDALVSLLNTDHVRQLTLVGLPGVGKTRLAQEAATRLHTKEELPVLWVPMETAVDGYGVDCYGIDGYGAGGYGAPDNALQTMTGWVRDLVRGGDTHDELADVIGAKRALIVLDGLDAAPATLRPLTNLLRSCERLTVLATTSRPAPTVGSRLLVVAPLPVPADAIPAGIVPGPGGFAIEPAECPAVELMLDRAGHTRPDLLLADSAGAILAQICQRLDGIPGALETAATWLLLHSPEQVLDIARTSPILLLDSVTEVMSTSSQAGYARRIRGAVAELDPQTVELARVMAELPEPWTLEEVARAADSSRADVVRGTHTLLTRGLVRQVPAVSLGDPVGFALLNVVRSLCSEPMGVLACS